MHTYVAYVSAYISQEGVWPFNLVKSSKQLPETQDTNWTLPLK